MISTIDRVLDEVYASREEWPIEEREEFLNKVWREHRGDPVVESFLLRVVAPAHFA